MSVVNYPLLSTIDSPIDLRQLSPEFLKQVTGELRHPLHSLQPGAHGGNAGDHWCPKEKTGTRARSLLTYTQKQLPATKSGERCAFGVCGGCALTADAAMRLPGAWLFAVQANAK